MKHKYFIKFTFVENFEWNFRKELSDTITANSIKDAINILIDKLKIENKSITELTEFYQIY